MSNVIGPIEIEDWYLLRQLREAVAHMKKRDPDKFRSAINKNSAIYKKVLKDVARAA